MRSLSFRAAIGVAVCYLLISAGSIYAQPTAEGVLEAAVKALGGRDAVTKVRNLTAIADCVGPNGPYTTEIYSARGNRLIFRQVRAGNVYVGFANGDLLWTKNEKTGDHTLAGAKEAFAWRSHDYQMLAMNVAERFKQIKYEGEESYGGSANAHKLSAVDELGNPAALYFDKVSNLMVGFVIQHPFSERAETIRNVFDEWKQVGKLRLPSKATVTDKQGDFILSFKEISINKTDEKLFAIPPTVTAMNELLVLHNKARADHFNRDAAGLVEGFADDYASIGAGKITRPTKEASLERFKSYFGNSTFLEWDDITPPVIKVSNDATMGYMIVHKRVRLLSKGGDGRETEVTEVYAWVALHRKINGIWQLTGIASTNTPEQDK